MEPQDPDITTEFSGFDDVVDLVESLAETPTPEVRLAHIQGASHAALEAVVVPLAQGGSARIARTEMLGRAAAVVVAVVLSISGLAAVGALPASAQGAVNVVAGYFGFQFPSAATEDDSVSEEPAAVADVSTTVNESTTTEAEENEDAVGVIKAAECDDENSDESEPVGEELGEGDDEFEQTDLAVDPDCTTVDTSTTTTSTTVTTQTDDDDSSSGGDDEGDDHVDDGENDEEEDG